MVIQSYLQLTGSVKIELIPANDLNLDKKKFKWYLKMYSETGLSLQLEFENPSYISFGGTDTLKITFQNTKEYLTPRNETLSSIPDGYTIVIKLPPQGDGLMSKEQLQQTQQAS